MIKELSKEWFVGLNGETLTSGDLRKDVTYELGDGDLLPPQELKCFKLIHLNGIHPISVPEIYREIFRTNFTPDIYDMRPAVGELIHRIRQRLGEKSIITISGKGYLSRRALIESMVKEKNPIIWF